MEIRKINARERLSVILHFDCNRKIFTYLKNKDKYGAKKSVSQKYQMFSDANANEGFFSGSNGPCSRSRNHIRSRCFQENVLVISIVPISFLRIDPEQ